MINSEFIIRYTNALYTTPPEQSPRYDEFRDMFSSGQIASKEWLVKTLENYRCVAHKSDTVIVGAWFGTLGIMLKKSFPYMNIRLLDIDPRCETFIKNITYDMTNIIPVTADMYRYTYTENIVINTSCEHISDLQKWLSLLKKGTVVVLQSNNMSDIPGHINCCSDEKEFLDKCSIENIWYCGKLEMPMYTRFMIIGST
jgi:hypothetical protein